MELIMRSLRSDGSVSAERRLLAAPLECAKSASDFLVPRSGRRWQLGVMHGLELTVIGGEVDFRDFQWLFKTFFHTKDWDRKIRFVHQ